MAKYNGGTAVGKEKEMSYSFYVSAKGNKPQDMKKFSDTEQKRIYERLGRQLVENGMQGSLIQQPVG